MAKIEFRKGRRSPMPMHKAEKARDLQARLKWLLDFLNTDIDSLSPIEFLKLFLDLGAFVNDPFFEQFEQVEIKTGKGLIKERKFLSLCQGILRGMLEKILMTAKQIGEESYPRVVDRFEKYAVHYSVFVTKDRVLKIPAPFLVFYRTYEEMEPLLIGMDNEKERIYKDIGGGLLADALIGVINRLHLSRIKTCQKPDCGNYFYQKTTKSKGDFCSQKCQNWARTNRWRKANPDKYNAYHRNRRNKAKEPWIKMICLNCGHEYPKGYPDLGVCSKCEGKLKYEVQFLEGREWKSEQCRNLNEAKRLRKEILEFEKSEGRAKNGKR